MWPQDGEIDFPEGDLDSAIMSAFMHQQGATSGSQQDAYTSSAHDSSWHTLVTEWTPNACTFILDGKTVGTATSLISTPNVIWVSKLRHLSTSTVNSTVDHIYIDWIAAYAQTS